MRPQQLVACMLLLMALLSLAAPGGAVSVSAAAPSRPRRLPPSATMCNGIPCRELDAPLPSPSNPKGGRKGKNKKKGKKGKGPGPGGKKNKKKRRAETPGTRTMRMGGLPSTPEVAPLRLKSPVGRATGPFRETDEQRKRREHREFYYLDDNNGFGSVDGAQYKANPVGRRTVAELEKIVREAKAKEAAEESKAWSEGEKQDLTPSAPVRWVHYTTFRTMEKHRLQQQGGEPHGFVHSNDQDFMNFAYKPGVEILPAVRDGPEFNLNNALNHPDRLLNTLAQNREDRHKEKQPTDSSSDGADGKPAIVEHLPGAAADESAVTGTDPIDESAEDWYKSLPVHAGSKPSPEAQASSALAQAGAPVTAKLALQEAQHAQQRAAEQPQPPASGAGGLPEPATQEEDDHLDLALQQSRQIEHQLAQMKVRQIRAQEQIVKTQHKIASRIPTSSLARIRERIRAGYRD